MKNVWLIMIILMTNTLAYTQSRNNEGWDIGVNWSVWILDEDNVGPPPGTDVKAVIMFKDNVGNVVYHETHTGTTTDFPLINFTVGQGTDSSGILTPKDFATIRTLCYAFEFEVDGEMKTITSEQKVASASRSNASGWAALADTSNYAINSGSALSTVFAQESGVAGYSDTSDYALTSNLSFKSNKFGNLSMGSQYNLVQAVQNWDQAKMAMIVNDTFQQLPLASLGTFKDVLKVPANQTTQVFYSQLGGTIPKFCGPEMPMLIENQYTTHIPVLEGFNHGLGVYVDSSSLTQVNAAVYFRNRASQGVGVFTDGINLGVGASGIDGIQGVSVSGNSGGGVVGFPAQAPHMEEVKSGIIGSSNGYGSTWGVFSSGPGGGTGPWTNSSDRRLKKDIHDAGPLLEKILQLRPRTYQFIQQEGRNVPNGKQIGFIAQEVEEIFPEVVTNLPMPELTGKYPNVEVKAMDYKGIQYGSLVPALTGAIQELNQKVEGQQQEIETLKAQLEILKQLIREKD